MRSKRIIALIVALFVVAAFAWHVYAAGTATVSLANKWDQGQSKKREISIVWVDNGGTTATVNATTLGIGGWVLYNCTGNPGTHALTDNFDMYLYDSDGVDVMGGAMVNSDNSTSVDYYPTKGFPVVRSNLTFTLSGNSQASGNGTLTCTFFQD